MPRLVHVPARGGEQFDGVNGYPKFTIPGSLTVRPRLATTRMNGRISPGPAIMSMMRFAGCFPANCVDPDRYGACGHVHDVSAEAAVQNFKTASAERHSLMPLMEWLPIPAALEAVRV